jgi:hypothetical protein
MVRWRENRARVVWLGSGSDLIRKGLVMRWLTKSSAPGGQVPPSEIHTPSAERRHRVRRFHYHPAALGRGSLYRHEAAPAAPEPANATTRGPTPVPAELSEKEQAHRVARNGVLLCAAILLSALATILSFNSSAARSGDIITPQLSWKDTKGPLILAGLAVAFFGVVLFDKFVRLLQKLRPK